MTALVIDTLVRPGRFKCQLTTSRNMRCDPRSATAHQRRCSRTSKRHSDIVLLLRFENINGQGCFKATVPQSSLNAKPVARDLHWKLLSGCRAML